MVTCRERVDPRTLVLLMGALLVAAAGCGAGASRTDGQTAAAGEGAAAEEGPGESGETAEPSPPTESTADTTEVGPAEPHQDPPATDASNAAVCAVVYADMRGLPHRGPYDVAQSTIDARAWGLAEELRTQAGTPEPVVWRVQGLAAAGARFATPAQCARVVALVAPEPPANASPRMRFSTPHSRGCRPCEAGER